jgi:protein-S-isoprenylcysteine O-methyltransferase Ste14
MVSLLLRNLFFTILHPGLVAGLIPFWILGRKANSRAFQSWQFSQYSGALVCAIGLVIMLSCIISFAVRGLGTLSPADPTKRLVITGLYRFSRNPMYIGVMMILIGEAIFFQSVNLWIYLLVVFIGFNIFILLHEEPRLRRDFGEEYNRYCQKIRRWI